MTVTFTIPGAPSGKGRPRFNRRTGKTRKPYTPQKTRDYEETVRECCRTVLEAPFPPDMALRCEIFAAFPVAPSDSKPKRQRKLADLLKPTKKPDWDNIGKIVCDALNGIAYHDDAQITCAVVKKRYAAFPCVRVTLSEDCETAEEQTEETAII